MEASPLMDQKGFVLKLEEAYQAMWKKWCSSKWYNNCEGIGLVSIIDQIFEKILTNNVLKFLSLSIIINLMMFYPVRSFKEYPTLLSYNL